MVIGDDDGSGEMIAGAAIANIGCELDSGLTAMMKIRLH